jgi:hypothetical protein
VPEDQLDCPTQGKHEVGEHSDHFDHYYDLLRSPGMRPELLFDERQDKDLNCIEIFTFDNSFVDPFACTIGSGCPPEAATDC